MTTPYQRIDDALANLLQIHDSRAGRDLTRNQREGYDAARRDLSGALASAGSTLGEYATLMAKRVAATDDPDEGERATRDLQRVVERSRNIVRGEWESRRELATGEPDAYDFRTWMQTFRQHGRATIDLEPSETYSTRALQSAGGSAVPTDFADRVAMYQRYASPMLDGSIVTIENRSDGGPIVFPRLTADPSSSGTVTAEAAGITVGDATISSVTVQPFGYKWISEWSRELDTDNAIGLEDLIAKSIARELSISSGGHLTSGTGTVQPWGIVTRAGNGGTATGTAGNTSLDALFGPADLIDLKYALQPIYRARGAFMVSSTAMKKIRKFRDANKQFLVGIDRNGIATFDGSPIYENPAMSAAASAAKAVLFGDLSAYTTVRVATRIELSLDAKWGTDQVSMRVVDRISGDMPDTAAVVYQVCADV